MKANLIDIEAHDIEAHFTLLWRKSSFDSKFRRTMLAHNISSFRALAEEVKEIRAKKSRNSASVRRFFTDVHDIIVIEYAKEQRAFEKKQAELNKLSLEAESENK